MSIPADVIIVGGSLAGLMHALVLRSLGRNVIIFEARPFQELQARAAGLSLWPHAQKLINKHLPDVNLDAIAIRNTSVQIRTGDGALLVDTPGRDDVRTTSWAIVHGLLLQACEKRSEGEGKISFEMGKRVCGVHEQGDTMVVTYKDRDGTEREAKASMVLAADGSRSFIRSQVMPDVTAQYAGYVAWRGRLAETEAPEELAGALEGKLILFRFQGSYVLVYVYCPLLKISS
jgi:2-polyprenyl-6-methoxyphenol hydroxylase-like FAD-dependent oxidoreductase